MISHRPYLYLLAFVVAATACDQTPTSTPIPTDKVSVTTTELTELAVESYERVPGSTRAQRNAALEAKVSGRISSLKAAEGRAVKQGEVLVEIDAHEIQARLDQAVATVRQAERDFQRISALLPSGAATRREYDAAEARLEVAKASVEETRVLLSYTRITAPFDGAIVRKYVDEGDFAQPGKVLLSMEGGAGFRFELDVPETLSRDLKLNQEIRVSLSDAQDSVNGRISEMSPSADVDSRTQHLKLELPEVPGVRSGQFGYAYIPATQNREIRVPVSAVTLRGQMETVFVVKDGRAVLRLIRTGKRTQDSVQVLSGLIAGDRLVVQSVAALSDGCLIEEQS